MAELNALHQQVGDLLKEQDGSWQQRQALLSSIEELRIAAMGPTEYITQLRYQALQNMSIVIALEMNLLKPIVERKGESITADELAETTKSERTLIVRIMRMLTSLRLANETSVDTYASNAQTDVLIQPNQAGAMRFFAGPTLRNMSNAVKYMRAHDGRFLEFPDPFKGEQSIADFTYGAPLWELLRMEPETLADFSAYLSGRRENLVGQWFDIYPAASHLSTAVRDLGERALVVDVGGNIGYDLQAFQHRFPDYSHHRLVLQDLAENITKTHSLLTGTGIECSEYDFFTSQPIKGARYYVFCGIFHDWPDREVKSILQHTAEAMDEQSTLIIDEMPLPDEKAPMEKVTYDILMMINVSGIERTIGHWKRLLDECGLDLKSVHESALDSALEVKLKGC